MDQEIIATKLRDIRSQVDRLIAEIEGTAGERVDGSQQIAWGAKLSPDVKDGILWIEQELGLKADYLSSCIAFETGGTFSPSIRNAAGSGAIGLIQFMRSTHVKMVAKVPSLKGSAPTHADLGKLSALQQLSWVFWYFRLFKDDFSEDTLEDIYMYILFPKAVGKPLDWPMPWKYGSIAYQQNAGLDLNKDHIITKAEAAAGVQKQYRLGMQMKG